MARIKHFAVIDSSETQAVVAMMVHAHAAAKGSAVAAEEPAVSNVTGNVQRFTQQDGQAGWTPLSGGASSLYWQPVQSSATSVAYIFTSRERTG